jgi:hypothetical protein
VPTNWHARSHQRNQIERDCILWSDFESNVVEGRYPLGKLVRSEGRCGWFETQFDEKAAIIGLIESLNDETIILDRLRAVEKVRDENVVTVFESGTTRVRATPLVYAVMEYTEENLEDVLRTRPLSAEETKQVADGLLHALRAIHKERLVCGRLEAAGVLASGDTLKLRSDYLQLVPQNAAFEPYSAKDVRDLGSLLHQCLTQKPLNGSTDGNDPSLQLLAPPFVEVVRRTLSGQATVDEIVELLHPTAAPAPVQPKPMQRAMPGVEFKPPHAEQVEKASLPQSASKRRPLVIGGFFVVLLLAGFALWAMLHHSDRPQDAAQNPVVVVSPETATPRKASPVVPPPAAKPKAAAVPAAVTPSPSAAGLASPGGMWRVVAFTYNYQDQAEHKARSINEKHPDLQASVFSPKGSGAPYLVTLGNATDRASAFRLRDKAVQERLPKDTYAQNYSR